MQRFYPLKKVQWWHIFLPFLLQIFRLNGCVYFRNCSSFYRKIIYGKTWIFDGFIKFNSSSRNFLSIAEDVGYSSDGFYVTGIVLAFARILQVIQPIRIKTNKKIFISNIFKQRISYYTCVQEQASLPSITISTKLHNHRVLPWKLKRHKVLDLLIQNCKESFFQIQNHFCISLFGRRDKNFITPGTSSYDH